MQHRTGVRRKPPHVHPSDNYHHHDFFIYDCDQNDVDYLVDDRHLQHEDLDFVCYVHYDREQHHRDDEHVNLDFELDDDNNDDRDREVHN